jgi:molybdate transport system ATP-binding protein
MIAISIKKLLRTIEIDVQLQLFAEGIYALSGPSGSGKTSLFNMISGLMQADYSYIEINGCLYQNMPLRKRRVGYVYQRPYLFPHLSIKKNLDYAWKRGNHKNDPIFYANLIEKFEMLPLLDFYPHQLSGGQLQRSSITQNLLAGPRLLLMDEPFSALDIKTKNNFMHQLKEHITHYRIPTLYISHAEQEIYGFAKHVIFFDEGKVTTVKAVIDIDKLSEYTNIGLKQ